MQEMEVGFIAKLRTLKAVTDNKHATHEIV